MSEVFRLELQKHDTKKKVLGQNLLAQENILQALTETNARWHFWSAANGQRHYKLLELLSGHRWLITPEVFMCASEIQKVMKYTSFQKVCEHPKNRRWTDQRSNRIDWISCGLVLCSRWSPHKSLERPGVLHEAEQQRFEGKFRINMNYLNTQAWRVWLTVWTEAPLVSKWSQAVPKHD